MNLVQPILPTDGYEEPPLDKYSFRELGKVVNLRQELLAVWDVRQYQLNGSGGNARHMLKLLEGAVIKTNIAITERHDGCRLPAQSLFLCLAARRVAVVISIVFPAQFSGRSPRSSDCCFGFFWGVGNDLGGDIERADLYHHAPDAAPTFQFDELLPTRPALRPQYSGRRR